MQQIEKHKALIITLLITCSVVFAMFSIHITKKIDLIAEIYYDIEQIKENENEELEEDINPSKATTNKAFNEDQEFKALMKNFKMVDANDFEKTTKAIEKNKTDFDNNTSPTLNYSTNGDYALQQGETESYKKLKDILDKKTTNKNTAEAHSKSRSTLTYSLKNRTLLNYKTPRYLCERSGKIVVSISVNENGDVFEASINGASNSANQCLTEHALQYAKSVRFTSAERTNQIGTITFYFKGKN